MTLNNPSKGYIALFLTTLFWGMTFVVIHLAAPFINTDLFVLIRFILGTLFLFPFILKLLPKTKPHHLLAGALLGLFNITTYISQTQGLKTLDPASSAFITEMSVIFVPMLLPLFSKRIPTLIEGVACLFSLLGLYVLTGANLSHLTPGIIWTLLCAISVALTIIYTQIATTNVTHVNLIAFYQIFFTCLYACVLLPFSGKIFVVWNQAVCIALLYCAFFATTITLLLMTRYQRYIPATHAAILYCLEPLFASIFSYWFVHEHFHRNIWYGGGCILASLFIVTLFPLFGSSRKA